MAVGRDGRPEAETLLWETSAKLHAEKPAAGSGLAVVSERRRASPGPAKVPVAPGVAARTKPRATGANMILNSEHVPCAPAAPPRHPARPSARGTRLSAVRAVVAAPKIPAAPARASERTASPRVRAMAALAEFSKAQARSPAVPPASVTTREAPVSVAPASVGPTPATTRASSSVSVAAAPPSVAPAVAPAPTMPAAPQECQVQQDLPPFEVFSPCEVRELAVVLEDLSTIIPQLSPIKTPTKVRPPTLDDKPVATPTNSMRPCLINLNVSAAVPTRSVCVAEMWLRLARIAMLEMGKLPPCAAIVGKPFTRCPYNEPSNSLQVRLQREYEAAQREAEETQREADGTQGEYEAARREANENQREYEAAQQEADETQREADETQRDADETRRDADETHQEADATQGFGVPQPQECMPSRHALENAASLGVLDEACPGSLDEARPRECGEGTPQGSCDPNPWMSMAFPEQHDGDDEHGPANAPRDAEERALQAWSRILMRVFSVTMGGPMPPPGPEYDADEDTHERQEDEDAEQGTLELPPGACDGNGPRGGCAHVCLGELMEESVSWIDVDSEDDCHSPKEADQMRAMQEEAEEEPVEMPRGMKDVYRQQNAPGIVAGMQKCLSFF